MGARSCCQALITFITDSIRILKALICRIIYAVHAFIGLKTVHQVVNNQQLLNILYIIYGLIPLEAIYNLKFRKGKEYKWWSPVTLCYLMSIVPSLLILEVYQHESRGALQAYKYKNYKNMNDVKWQFTDQFFKDFSDQKEIIGEYQDSFASNFFENNCENGSNGGNLDESFCQCLAEDFQLIFTVNFGEQVFTPVFRNESDMKNLFSTLANVKPTRASRSVFDVDIDVDPTNQPDPTQAALVVPALPRHRLPRQTNLNQILSNDAKNQLTNLGQSASSALQNTGQVLGKNFQNAWNLAEQAWNEKENIPLFNVSGQGIGQFTGTYFEKKLAFTEDISWTRVMLHQSLLFVLVIGRWILPKGKISSSELSQLLLVFIAVAADIIEFMTETIDEDNDRAICNTNVHYAIWFVWMWSLTQFVMVLTASKGRKVRAGFGDLEDEDDYDDQGEDDTDTDERHKTKLSKSKRKKKTKTPKKVGNSCCGILNNSDLWGMCITLIFQDGPFLTARLYLILVQGFREQMLFFFTAKNILIILLQLYRMLIICCDQNNDGNLDFNDFDILKKTLQNSIIEDNTTQEYTSKASFKQSYMDVKTDPVTGKITVIIQDPTNKKRKFHKNDKNNNKSSKSRNNKEELEPLTEVKVKSGSVSSVKKTTSRNISEASARSSKSTRISESKM